MMRALILILISLSFTVNASFAITGTSGEKAPKTYSLSGKVIDKSNQEVLAGVLIRIEDLNLETYTDLEGKFSFEGLVPETYKLKCSLISYSDSEQEVAISKTGNEVEITLQNVSANISVK